jgi:hypothetical protein
VADLYRHLMPSIAVPGVLVRLDFTPERAARIHREAMELREAEAAEGEGDLEEGPEADIAAGPQTGAGAGAEAGAGAPAGVATAAQ